MGFLGRDRQRQSLIKKEIKRLLSELLEKEDDCEEETRVSLMGKQLSGAQKRKKKREKEELAAEMERLKLGPTKIWTGLVLHHKDVFVSHVLSKLNTTDRWFFSEVNRESRGVLEYAGLNVSEIGCTVYECLSISTLELVWNNIPWGEKSQRGRVMDQAWFCKEVAATNKLERTA